MTNLSMVQVINLCASRRPVPAPCPCCGADAPLASKGGLGGYFFIACTTDGCGQCSEGETLAQVWESWNAGVTV